MQHDVYNTLEEDIYPILAPNVASVLKKVSGTLLGSLTEIRLRICQPLLLVLDHSDVMLRADGIPTGDSSNSYICSTEDIQKTLQLISKNSLYAFEQEIKLGYLTVKGGHRVGLAGQAVIDEGKIRTVKNISSMNIRLAREIKGCANKIIPYIVAGENTILNTLIISPPRSGKTTIIRDVIRLISNGVSQLGFKGVQVGVVDERSEIAACKNGTPTVDLGQRADVLDGCLKAYGLLMLIRSMSPQVLVTDELGRQEDAYAIREALTAGIGIVATIHGKNLEDIYQRPYIGDLVRQQCFDRYIILKSIPSPGTVEAILDKQGKPLFGLAKGEILCG